MTFSTDTSRVALVVGRFFAVRISLFRFLFVGNFFEPFRRFSGGPLTSSHCRSFCSGFSSGDDKYLSSSPREFVIFFFASTLFRPDFREGYFRRKHFLRPFRRGGFRRCRFVRHDFGVSVRVFGSGAFVSFF